MLVSICNFFLGNLKNRLFELNYYIKSNALENAQGNIPPSIQAMYRETNKSNSWNLPSHAVSQLRKDLKMIKKLIQDSLVKHEYSSVQAVNHAKTLMWLIDAFVVAPHDSARDLVNQILSKLTCEPSVRDFKNFVLQRAQAPDAGLFVLKSEAHQQFWGELNRLGARNMPGADLSNIPDIDATVILTLDERIELEEKFAALP